MDLITQIKKALETAGLDVGLAEKIKVTEASQIGAEVEKLKEKLELTPEQFIEACKEAGLESSLTQYVQKIGDKRVSDGIKSYETNRNKKDLSDKERIETLEKELEAVKGTQAKKDLETLIKKELKSQDLSEDLIKYIKIDNDDPFKITEAVKSLKDDLLNAKQAEIDQKLKEGGIPARGESTTGDNVIEKFAENKNAGKTAGAPFKGILDNKEGE